MAIIRLFLSYGMLLLSMLPAVVPATTQAALITFNFEAPVTSSFNAPGITDEDIITGSYTFDDATAGVFTPKDFPFEPDTTLFAGAVTSVSATVNGNTLSGTSGDIRFDDYGESPLGFGFGDDLYEVEATLTSGDIGGIAATSFILSVPYPYDTDPSPVLGAVPPTLTGTVFPSVSIFLDGGNIIADLTLLESAAGTPVPLPPSVLFLTGGLVIFGVFRHRRVFEDRFT